MQNYFHTGKPSIMNDLIDCLRQGNSEHEDNTNKVESTSSESVKSKEAQYVDDVDILPLYFQHEGTVLVSYYFNTHIVCLSFITNRLSFISNCFSFTRTCFSFITDCLVFIASLYKFYQCISSVLVCHITCECSCYILVRVCNVRCNVLLFLSLM